MHPALEAIAGKRIIVVGDVVLDHFVRGEVDRISPEAPVPVVRVTRENDMPGAAANVALNLAALDARPIMVGIVGDDADGRRLRELLVRHNVDCTYLITDKQTRTTRKTRVIARAQHLVRVDWDTVLDRAAVQRCGMLNAVTQAIPACDGVVVQDYNKGLITDELMEMVSRVNVPVVVDPNRYHPIRYRGTVSTPNLEEARILSGVAHGSSQAIDHLDEIAGGFFARHDVRHLVITLGEHGIALCAPDGVIRRRPAACTHDVYDVSGAGDTVAAMLASALAAGVDLWTACQLANAAGGIVVGKMGTATTSRDEIQNLLDQAGPGALAP
ncbi:D-glycero-beta-D-manno-heptose-7-phosphate kinase [bacterium]|nr:D-glycero-beta-D-manno-heptose-7-phosphate kinase [bacterium]